MVTTTVNTDKGKKVYCIVCKKEISKQDLEKGICSNCISTIPKPSFKFGHPTFHYWWVFKMDVPTLFGYLKNILLDIYRSVHHDSTCDYLYAEGDIPILLVAHMDTVHKKLPRVEHDHEQNILWSKNGLGADDRAGVIAILRILEDGYRPHVLFTDGEESGCLGSKVAVKSLDIPHVNYIIQLDRRGKEDSVFYDNDNNKFEEYVNSFGFKTADGSFSDISELCPSWGISGVNLSVGYYDAHRSTEYLKIDEFESTVNKVKKMLDSPPDEMFDYIEKPYSYGLFGTGIEESIIADKFGVSMDIPAVEFHEVLGGTEKGWREFFEFYGDYIAEEVYSAVLDTVMDLALELNPECFDI